jgi:hypothetical protein
MTRGFAVIDDIYQRVLAVDDGDLIYDYLAEVDLDRSLVNALFSRAVIGLLYEATYHAVTTLASLDTARRADALVVSRRFKQLGETSNVLGNLLTFDANGDRLSTDYVFFDVGADDTNSTQVVWRSNAAVSLDDDVDAPSTWLRSSIDQYFVLRDDRDASDTRALCVEFFVVRCRIYIYIFSV